MTQKTMMIIALVVLTYIAYYFYGTTQELRSKKAPKPDTQGG